MLMILNANNIHISLKFFNVKLNYHSCELSWFGIVEMIRYINSKLIPGQFQSKSFEQDETEVR